MHSPTIYEVGTMCQTMLLEVSQQVLFLKGHIGCCDKNRINKDWERKQRELKETIVMILKRY